MELFKIMGTIAINASEARSEIKSTTESASSAATKISSAFSSIGGAVGTVASKVGSVIAGAAKVGVAAVGVASAGVAALTKSAVENQAEFEQLVGGAETLFKDSADTVKRYALNAYETAGMTANEYLNTVTSFSASLLQGLGNDTEKAAQYANTAVTDMSDNANKMGTSISLIQNAYQGFAKQNYTMLDNLKLGYGGTASEMARLINDAGVLGDTVEVTAETVNSVSFDKIIEAIHVVQDNMGITGTTANEAAETISGSVASMKAAWGNLVGALASDDADLSYFINNFVESVKTAASNLLPAVENALNGVSTLVSSLSPMIAEAIPELVTNVLPNLLQAGIDILEAIIQGIVDSVPSLVEQAPEIISRFLEAIENVAGLLWDAGGTLMNELGMSIQENGPAIIGEAIDSLMTFLSEKLGVTDETLAAFEETIQVAWDAISGIFESVQTAIGSVVDAISGAGITWGDVWTGISDALSVAGELIGSAIELIGAAIGWLVTEATTDGTLINTVWENIQTAISAAVEVIQGVIDVFIAIFSGNWSEAWETAESTVSDLLSSISDIISNKVDYYSEKISSALDSIKGFFSEKLGAAKETVTDIFDSIKTDIQEKIEWARDKVQDAIDAIKGFFDFEFSWPHIPLPHFGISPSGWKVGDLLKGTIPTLSIDWYAKAMDDPMIMEGATPFGINNRGQIMAGGEKGSEVVSGTETLMQMISEAVASQNAAMIEVLEKILVAIKKLDSDLADSLREAMEGMSFRIQNREFARLVKAVT